MEVQNRHDDDLVEVQPCLSLPNTFQGEVPLMGGQAAKSGQKLPLHDVEFLFGNRLASIVGQRQVEVIPSGASGHVAYPRDRWEWEAVRKAASSVAAERFARRSRGRPAPG